MKKIYSIPCIKVLYLEDLCQTLQSATVVSTSGGSIKPIDQFTVHETDTPNGEDDSWFDNTNHWGGD